VENRDDDVHVGERAGHALGRDRQCLDRGAAFAALIDLTGDAAIEGARLAGLELPLPLAVDLDRHGVVSIRIQRLEHGARRGDRDVVLARAAPADDGDPDAAAHGTAPV
jgi:hypothetical protein